MKAEARACLKERKVQFLTNSSESRRRKEIADSSYEVSVTLLLHPQPSRGDGV
jgi:hypothetical protein